jgi:hypothetical protein
MKRMYQRIRERHLPRQMGEGRWRSLGLIAAEGVAYRTVCRPILRRLKTSVGKAVSSRDASKDRTRSLRRILAQILQ